MSGDTIGLSPRSQLNGRPDPLGPPSQPLTCMAPRGRHGRKLTQGWGNSCGETIGQVWQTRLDLNKCGCGLQPAGPRAGIMLGSTSRLRVTDGGCDEDVAVESPELREL